MSPNILDGQGDNMCAKKYVVILMYLFHGIAIGGEGSSGYIRDIPYTPDRPEIESEPDNLEQVIIIMEGEDRSDRMPKVEFAYKDNQLEIFLTYDRAYRRYLTMPNTNYTFFYYQDQSIKIRCDNPPANEGRSISYMAPVGSREKVASIDMRAFDKNERG